MTDANIPTSRNIPGAIQRTVRQRCGFGCVICGLPLYEYDHLLGWANVHRHAAEEITLLCDQHHREKTSGLLTQEQVEAANADPYNHRAGVSRPYDLHFGADECTIEIGSNTFTGPYSGDGTLMVPLVIDGVMILGFLLIDGHVLLNLSLFDEYNLPALQIQNNVLMYSTSPWDIELIGKRLRIRERPRKFLLDIVFEPPSRVVVRRGRFLLNGVEVLVRPDGLSILHGGRFLFQRNHGLNVHLGIVLGTIDPPGPCMVRLSRLVRYSGDRSEAEAWEQESFTQ